MKLAEQEEKGAETRQGKVDRREFLRYAAIGAGGLVLAGCANAVGESGTPAGGPAGGAGQAAKAAFDPTTALAGLVMVASTRAGRVTNVVDLGEQRVLGVVNYPENKYACKPHHFTMIPTDKAHAGFYGLQTCRSSSETFILEYKPRDPTNPVLGGEFRVKEDLTKKYGLVSNHHTILKPDHGMWAISDDQYDVLTFVSTQEPYRPLRAYAFKAEKSQDGKKVVRAWPEELKADAEGKFKLEKPQDKFGALRHDSGCWTADGRWFIEGSRNIGVNWVIDGKTLDIVHAFPTAAGSTMQFADPNDARKGVIVGDNTTVTHGCGVTNDSKHLLVNDMKGNSTAVYDIADPNPRQWKEIKRIPFPGQAVNPYHTNFSPDGKYALIALRSYDTHKPGTGGTAVVDTKTWEIVKICEMPGFVEAHGIAVTPDGKYFIQAYAGWDTSGGGHVVWSLETLEPVHRMPTAVAAHEAVLVQTSKITNGC